MRHAALFTASALLGAALAFAGCSPVVRIHTPDPAQADEHRVVIRDAAKKMGVRIRVTEATDPASIEVTFKGADAGVCGVALEKVAGFPERPAEVAQAVYEHISVGDYRAAAQAAIDCSPRAWSCVSADALAHELGHVLGLSHKDGTAMDPTVSPEPFTDRQKLVMHGVALGLAEICEADGGGTDPREPSE